MFSLLDRISGLQIPLGGVDPRGPFQGLVHPVKQAIVTAKFQSREHLSVIDVPGIFKKSTPGVTTKADMAMVRNMVINPITIFVTICMI